MTTERRQRLVFLLVCGLVTGAGAGEISPFNGVALPVVRGRHAYRFVTGGHLYGTPDTPSVYPSGSVLGNLPRINESGADLFVTLGDIYRVADDVHMSRYLDAVAKRLQMPMFNAVGNHDIRDGYERARYEAAFGPTYHAFGYGGDRFIVLDSEAAGGNIEGAQLAFLREALTSAAAGSEVRNIFIFTHKLIWCVSKPGFELVFDHVNSKQGYAQPNNFVSDVEPLVAQAAGRKAVYWFSGDIGCPWTLSLFMARDPNTDVRYVAAGLGDTPLDALVQVDVNVSGDVALSILPLGPGPFQALPEYDVAHWTRRFGAARVAPAGASRFGAVRALLGGPSFRVFCWGGIAGAVIAAVLFFTAVAIHGRRR